MAYAQPGAYAASYAPYMQQQHADPQAAAYAQYMQQVRFAVICFSSCWVFFCAVFGEEVVVMSHSVRVSLRCLPVASRSRPL